MAQLIRIVKGGYEIDGTKEFIPAQNLIPFGSLHKIPDGQIFSKSSLKDGWRDSTKEMNIKASEYASSMNSPFYELKIEHDHTSIEGFIKKTIYILESGKIQLYVENKK